jgi:hypothetical protein
VPGQLMGAADATAVGSSMAPAAANAKIAAFTVLVTVFLLQLIWRQIRSDY